MLQNPRTLRTLLCGFNRKGPKTPQPPIQPRKRERTLGCWILVVHKVSTFPAYFNHTARVAFLVTWPFQSKPLKPSKSKPSNSHTTAKACSFQQETKDDPNQGPITSQTNTWPPIRCHWCRVLCDFGRWKALKPWLRIGRRTAFKKNQLGTNYLGVLESIT